MTLRTRNPDEEVVRRAAPDQTLGSVVRQWRSLVRAQGWPRPDFTRPAELPSGLASAITAPVVTQCLILAHQQGTNAVLPVIESAVAEEERLRPVTATEELHVHVRKRQAGVWIAECEQRGELVARVTWTWREAAMTPAT